jgi:hypothetical protein
MKVHELENDVLVKGKTFPDLQKKVLCWPLASWLGLPIPFDELSVDTKLNLTQISHHTQGTCIFFTLLYVGGPSLFHHIKFKLV